MTKEVYKEKRNDLINRGNELMQSGDLDSADTVMNEIIELDSEYERQAQAEANFNALNNQKTSNIITNMIGDEKMTDNTNFRSTSEMYSSSEYRNAFMRNVLTGEKIPDEFKNAAQQSSTSDVGAVIPTTVMEMIIQKIEKYGTILPLVTQTAYKGGVTIPVSAVNVSASWVAERSTSDSQKFTTGAVTFAYHKLICKVAVSFEVDKVTLDVFERTVAENISKAMVKALEQAIFTGEGDSANQPKGFLTETAVDGQNIELTTGSHITYEDICAAEAALPEGYEETAVWTMTKKTFFNEIIGMTDTNGQPIARLSAGLDEKPEYSIFGRKVVLNSYMSSFTDSPSADTIVAALFDFNGYVLNTNYALTIRKYTDEATDDVVSKAIMLVDGKTVDKNSLVTITLKNS